MSQQIGKLQSLVGGVSTVSKKIGPANSFAWGRSIDFRSDPAQQTTLSQTRKISGSIVTDLPMAADVAHDANAIIVNQTNTLFFHGNTGSIYAIDSSDNVSKEYTVPNSSGNGIVYLSETNQLYIPTNTSISRRDMTTGNYYNNFLETSGGAPTNTKALLLVAASSQSATRASTSSLQLSGDMTLEAYLKPTSLPGSATSQRGISMSGLEFGSNVPGALNQDYFISSQNTFTYFGNKGFKTVRLPFSWERLQPTLGGDLDATYKGYIDTQITYAANAGMQVILDCHNYGRRKKYVDGGITENFTAPYPNLLYPWADYTQSGSIVLRDYGQSFIGTLANPVGPAASYTIGWTMQFNSRDTTFGNEGLYVRPYYMDASNYYEFHILNDGTNTWTLSKVVAGTPTSLKTGTFGFAWGTNVSHAFVIDIAQATTGKINIKLDGVALYTANSASTDAALTGGKVGFYAAGVHVQLSSMVLNVAGSTTGGGITVFRVGDTGLTTANFASLWDKISTAYAANTTVLGYDLMNEPHDMPVPTTPSNYNSTSTVTLMMQAAITAIRANDSTHYIFADLDQYAGAQNFVNNYGTNPTPWLTDSAGKLLYSFHYYFDNDHSGTYANPFASTNNTNISGDVSPIMQWGKNNNVKIHCGEYGVPNQSDWLVCLTTFLGLCNQYTIWANHWAAGDNYSDITTLQPTGSSPSYTDQLQMSIVGQSQYLSSSTTSATTKMTIVSKWDESSTKLGYKLDIVTTSAAFGNGSDGSRTISVDTTDAPIDSACTGTAGTNTVTATNASFAPLQEVLIHQSQGVNAGQYERNSIQSYVAGKMTLTNNLTGSYGVGAQVLVLHQYTDVTVNTNITWTAKKWDGTTGGILAFLATGIFTCAGTISANACGFRQGIGATAHQAGVQGEGVNGIGSITTAANGNGGGGGQAITDFSASGAGGSNGTQGANGVNSSTSSGGIAGNLSGSTDLTTLTFGGAGGRAGATSQNNQNSPTGHGGGILFSIAANTLITGLLTANGGNGPSAQTSNQAGSGAGSGGGIYMKFQTGILGSNLLTVAGGIGGAGVDSNPAGGNGGYGRIAIDYYTSYTGTTSPSFNTTQDNTLGIANGHALRLYISDDGSSFETYTQQIADFIGVWKLYSVSWQAATSTAIFYENGQPIGTVIGAKKSINQNTAIFAIGCYVNSSSAKTGFLDSLVDDVRIWAAIRTPAQITNYYNQILSGLETNLVAYYPMDGAVTDAQTSGLNNLTANNSPTYSTDVAFKGVTTRGDEDVFLNKSGFTYTLKTALSETATDKISFVPTKEPFKSLALNIDTIGTGNWTVTVHDELNNVVATMTVPHADIQTGIYEFKFPSTERIILNATYHVHVFDTTGDGKVVTSVASDLSTAYLKTYFQILVNDTYHQAVQFQNFACIANERYLATLQAGNVYNPARLIFPSGYRIRSLAFWQQYLAIGMWFGNNITDTDNGKVFFWDGQSDTYIDALDVPQGGINAMLGTQGGLLISAGYKGAMLEYTGYPSSYRYTARTSAQLAFRLPNTSLGDTVEIAPQAMAMWNSMNRIGTSLNTNSTTIHQGIYTYGQYIDTDPMSVGFDYPLSIGDNTNNTVKIGSLIARDAKLYAGFQNGNTFGIDVVDENADPYPTGTLELLITDLGSVAAKKLPLVFRTDFLPLVSGQSVSLKYKPDRASAWQTLGTQSNAGATDIRTTINKRVREAQFALDWVNTNESVTFTQYTLESDTLDDERQV